MAGGLKEVRERIRSVQNIQQITKAMKMVSAAKLRKAQQAIVQMRPYANKLNGMLRNILSNLDGDASSAFGQERPVEHVCIVPITSNRGLCGAFNSNIIKTTIRLVQEDYAAQFAQGRVTLLPVGKRGNDIFIRRFGKQVRYIKDYVTLFDDLSFDSVNRVPKQLMAAFEHKQFDKVIVVYGQFKNAGTQYTTVEQFLPVAKIQSDAKAATKADYIFEPEKEQLLEHLIPSILQTQFYKYVLDNHASEHGARMTAMDKATENANELLRDLRIRYNKARQESITNEILEIVGGAAALENG